MTDERFYKVIFLHQGQVYEIFAKQVTQGELYGFVEVEELVFGRRSEVVLDPSEESLKREFDGVKRTYIPMHSVLRIDEVEKEGASRILPRGDGNAKVTPFPVPLYTPGREPDKT